VGRSDAASLWNEPLSTACLRIHIYLSIYLSISISIYIYMINPRRVGRSDAASLWNEPLSTACLREFNQRVLTFQRIYVTLQEDGSEDDLSYIKLINYGDKVYIYIQYIHTYIYININIYPAHLRDAAGGRVGGRSELH